MYSILTCGVFATLGYHLRPIFYGLRPETLCAIGAVVGATVFMAVLADLRTLRA